MQCFEAQHRLADYLDGSLIAGDSQSLEKHLGACEACTERLDRSKTLLKVVREQPRLALPAEIRQSPFTASRLNWRALRHPRKRWAELPASVRMLIEGLSIAAVIFLGIRLGPQLRTMYERGVEQRLQTMIAAEDLSSNEIPLTRGKAVDPETGEMEFDSEDSEGSEAIIDSDIQVGKAEIWRFNLKTDSPTLTRTRIIQAFGELGIPSSTAGFGGTEAPGGIQFDLIVPQSTIPSLKARLEKMAAPPIVPGSAAASSIPPLAQSAETPGNDTFTWYKNRSKKPIPSGTSRVVIWLSQI